MPQERLTLRKIREILRLKWELGLSNRTIARSCRTSHSTVGEYVKRAETAGLKWPLPEDIDDEKLTELLFPRTGQEQKQTIPVPDWEKVHTELRRKGVTLQLLWMEYIEKCPQGYCYSQFCALYREWAKKLNPTMRLRHQAGETLYVDYTGQTVPVIDPNTGEIKEAEIFVAVLGASSYTYAEAQWAQDLANWTGGHVRTFEFIGGVTEVVVPDNLKAGVTHPCRYEPDINMTYQELAEYYGIAVVPARVKKPRDKAKAEVGVQVIERWILARLRDRKFFSLAELNRAIRKLLIEINERPMQHLGKSRKELFEELDRPALKPLPDRPYEFAIWKKARVNIDYHVEYDKHYYSVPHRLHRQEVYLRATERTLEIYFNRERIAMHPRSKAKGRHTTISEHMPPSHKHYHDWSPERFTRWAAKIGADTEKLIQIVLSSKKHPQQAYRSCLGILGFADKHGQDRLESACRYALAHDICSYRGIKNILVNKLDLSSSHEDAPQCSSLPPHNNIRGKPYYN
jgi:transposase